MQGLRLDKIDRPMAQEWWPGKWVAIFHGGVLATYPTRAEALRVAREMHIIAIREAKESHNGQVRNHNR